MIVRLCDDVTGMHMLAVQVTRPLTQCSAPPYRRASMLRLILGGKSPQLGLGLQCFLQLLPQARISSNTTHRRSAQVCCRWRALPR